MIVVDQQVRFYLSQWYGVSQEDIDRSTDESEYPTNIDETEYREKLLYHSPLFVGIDNRLIDKLLEELDLDA
jgi:hypothetical protein